MVKSCDSALALKPRQASYLLVCAAACWIDHGYEGARLEEWLGTRHRRVTR